MIKIGVLGMGKVGKPFLELCGANTGLLVAYIGVRSEDNREWRDAEITTDLFKIVNDPSVDIIVEAIDNSALSKRLIIDAIKSGKGIVSCSKELWAYHKEELSATALAAGVDMRLNSLVVNKYAESELPYDLDEYTIAEESPEEIFKFREADGPATARAMFDDLIKLLEMR